MSNEFYCEIFSACLVRDKFIGGYCFYALLKSLMFKQEKQCIKIWENISSIITVNAHNTSFLCLNLLEHYVTKYFLLKAVMFSVNIVCFSLLLLEHVKINKVPP